MTLSDLQSMVLSWLDDPQAGYFTLPVINVWLNNAQKEVQKLLLLSGSNWYLKCAQTYTVINQNLYVLPQDFRQVHRMEMVLNGTFPTETKSIVFPITFNQQDYSSQQTGTPEAYALKKSAIQVFPVPDSALKLRMNYSYMVGDMVLTSDVPDVPDQYQEFIAVLATLDGALKDKTDMSGIIAKKQYYEMLLKSDAQTRNVDQPRSVVVTEDDGFGRIF